MRTGNTGRLTKDVEIVIFTKTPFVFHHLHAKGYSMKPYACAFSNELFAFYNGDNVIVSEVPRGDTKVAAQEILVGSTQIVSAGDEGLVGTDCTTFLVFVAAWRDWSVRCELDCGNIRQIVINALTPPQTDAEFEIHSPTMRTYIGQVTLVVQCVLEDDSVWSWELTKSQTKKFEQLGHARVTFSSVFRRVEGLPAVRTMLWTDARSYMMRDAKATYILGTDNRISSVTMQSSEKATTMPVNHREVFADSILCIASNAPAHVGYVLNAGVLLSLYPDQPDVLPAALANRNDIRQCAVAYSQFLSTYQFFVVTNDGQLIVSFGAKYLYQNRSSTLLEGEYPAELIRTSKPGMVEELFCFPTAQQPVIYCRTPKQTFIELFLERQWTYPIADIPAMLRNAEPLVPVTGPRAVQPVPVAISKRSVYVIAPDSSVTRINFGTTGTEVLPTSHNNAVAVAAGWDHLLVLHADGTVSGELIGTPRQHYNQHIIPEALTNVVAISCGGWTSYALRADGSVVGWGRNDVNQTYPANVLKNIVGIHGGRHHALFLGQDGDIHHLGSSSYNDAESYPIVESDLKKLHAADVYAVAITNDNRVVDVFDERIVDIAHDETLVDVVALQFHYALLYATGRLVILNRFTLRVEDEEPTRFDPVVLVGINSIAASDDMLVCVGFDCQLYALRASAQSGGEWEIVQFPDTVRAATPTGPTSVPEDYQGEAFHRVNTFSLQLGAIKQHFPSMNAPVTFSKKGSNPVVEVPIGLRTHMGGWLQRLLKR